MIAWFQMRMHIKSPGEAPGHYPVVKRGEGLRFLSFSILELGGSFREFSFETGDEEVSLDFYTGAVNVEAEGAYGEWSARIPARTSIASAHPMVYVPTQSKVRLTAPESPARVTIGGALGKPGVPALIEGGQIVSKSVGKDNWVRSVHTHIADNVPAARLICGETVNHPGGWSSCPPHKHDRFNAPSEVPMEEVYYFQCDPKQGFGFIRVYTDPADPEPFDQSFAVEHGDTVLIPRGYHPVAACPGYTLNYTWILAGEGRTYGAWSDDPKHAWLRTT
ncbi:MAG TPA: 5-deoxy-glucuronate isomerase [Solibacterales bacterium]|nr:5-deoxy-glucuronate isomerase [Bryobacterales bacterium]